MKYRVSNKLFSAVRNYLRRINLMSLQEDFRKAGLVLIGAGYIGVIVGTDKISNLEGLALLLTGLLLWAAGLYEREG